MNDHLHNHGGNLDNLMESIPTEQQFFMAADVFSMLCDSTRLRILWLLCHTEECVSDTYLRAWNAIPPQRPKVLQAFFGTLTRNLSLDRWRRDRAEKRGGGTVELALEELEDCLAAREQVEQVIQAGDTARLISDFLRRQPKQDRQLFVRRYWYLDDIRALCQRFGMGESQVKSRLHRMRKKLKQELEREGVAV